MQPAAAGWRIAFYVALAVTTWALLAPMNDVARPVTDGAPRLLAPVLDKIVHAVAFAALGALAPLAHPALPRAWAFVALVVYGAATETLQSFVPGRSADVVDFLVDAAGAGVALALGECRGRAV